MKKMLAFVLVVALGLSGVAYAQDQDLKQELEQLKNRMIELEKKLAEQEAQKEKVNELEKKVAEQAKASTVKLPDWADRFSLDGIAYMRYSRAFDDSAKEFNEFDLDRAYLVLWAKLWDKGKIRYTLEGGDLRENGTDEFQVVTKHFFLEIQDTLFEGDYLRLGQTDLPWVPYTEGIWNYRFQGTVFADRSGYLTSTDLGIGYGGKFSKGYGSWQINVANGEGWKKNETGKHKDAHFRLTLNPLAGNEGRLKNIFVTGFTSIGTYEHDSVLTGGEPTDRNRTIVQLGYKEAEKWTLVGEYLWAEDPADKMKARHPSLAARPNQESHGRGFSLFGALNLSTLGVLIEADFARKWELIGRGDHLDPDTDIRDNNLDRYIFGVAGKWNKHVRTLLGWEQVDFETRARKNDERRLMLQTEIRF